MTFESDLAKARIKDIKRGLVIGGIVAPILVTVLMSAGLRDTPPKEPPFVLPTQERIQQCLKDRGYPVEVDGVIGADSRRYWDQAIITDTMKLMKERENGKTGLKDSRKD